MIVTRQNAGGFLLLKIPILNFNIDNFRSVEFFQLQNLFPQPCIFKFKTFHFIFMSVPQIFVLSQLIFELIVLVIIGSFEFVDLIFKEQDL